MDVFLIKDGKVENVVVVESMDKALAMYPGYTVVERTPANESTNIGDPAP